MKYLPNWLARSQSLKFARDWKWAIQQIHNAPFAAVEKEIVSFRLPDHGSSLNIIASLRELPNHHLSILSLKATLRRKPIENLSSLTMMTSKEQPAQSMQPDKTP